MLQQVPGVVQQVLGVVQQVPDVVQQVPGPGVEQRAQCSASLSLCGVADFSFSLHLTTHTCVCYG